MNALFTTCMQLAFFPTDTSGLGGTAYFLGLIYTYVSGYVTQSIIMERLQPKLLKSFSFVIDPLKKALGGGGGDSAVDNIPNAVVGTLTSILHTAAIIYVWEAPSHKNIDFEYKTFSTLNHSQMVVSGIFTINSAFKAPNVPLVVVGSIAETALIISSAIFAYKSK